MGKHEFMAIPKGTSLPDISLPDKKGQPIDLNDYLKGKIGVVFFYSKDHSPGCTKEVCSFRDSYEDFVDAGADVVGISPDSVESHRAFAESQNLPYLLLSDEDNVAREAFDVSGFLFGLFSGRVTFIFDRHGELVHSFRSQFNAVKHKEEAINAIEELIK